MDERDTFIEHVQLSLNVNVVVTCVLIVCERPQMIAGRLDLLRAGIFAADSLAACKEFDPAPILLCLARQAHSSNTRKEYQCTSMIHRLLNSNLTAFKGVISFSPGRCIVHFQKLQMMQIFFTIQTSFK